jgi:hypothetical protein
VREVENLKKEFDLKHNYRQFLETGVSSIEIETL